MGPQVSECGRTEVKTMLLDFLRSKPLGSSLAWWQFLLVGFSAPWLIHFLFPGRLESWYAFFLQMLGGTSP